MIAKIAIFASGSGTNAQNITEYFMNHPGIRVEIIYTNNRKAGVIERAKALHVPFRVFDRQELYQQGEILTDLKNHHIDYIVLAGFLWLVPTDIISHYSGRILNIHPALLPKYGGKGMYGNFVHEAVLANKESISGITIHWVTNHYDEGDIIFQSECQVTSEDSPESLAKKIHALEYQYFPRIIEETISRKES